MNKNWKTALLFTLLVMGLNLALIFDVGFLSDDWSILERTQNGSIFSAVEQHHYSPFVTAIFKITNTYSLSPLWIHLLAFTLHGVNIYLTLSLCDSLKMNRWEKWITATLFALSPAGFESLAWCCAIGYILCSTWIILALQITISSSHTQSRSFPYKLALLQLLAFATWDWGILLTPLVGVVKWFYLEEYNFKGTLPAIFIWCGVLLMKKLTGFSLGYETNSTTTALQHAATSFMLTLWPDFSRNFYSSFWGLILACFTLLAYLWMSYRDRISRLGLLLFLVSVMPVALIGYPQSRYVYLSALFLYWILARLLNPGLIGKSLAIVYVFFSIMWTVERKDLWIEAHHQAQFYRKNVESALKTYEKVALLNSPDQLKGSSLVWLPPIWRCGTECFGPNVLIMNPYGKKPLTEEDIPPTYEILHIGELRKLH